MGRRVLRRVLRRGSKKGLSRRRLEDRSTSFREYNPVGVYPRWNFRFGYPNPGKRITRKTFTKITCRRDDNKNKICGFEGGGGIRGIEEKRPKRCFSWETPRQYKFECENLIVEKFCCHCASSYKLIFTPNFMTPLAEKNGDILHSALLQGSFSEHSNHTRTQGAFSQRLPSDTYRI